MAANTSRSRSKPDWAAIAGRVAAAIPPERLHPAVLGWTEERRHSRKPWGVALSGGADSLLLLLLLWAHWPARQNRLVAMHFDHRLRGRESTADRRFCERLAKALGIELAVGRWERPPAAGKVSEAAARAARQAFFAETARGRRLGAVWLGHQRDDVAETMLMRLARGSGPAGLAAPRPVQATAGEPDRLRPLLDVSKAEVVAVLTAAGAIWREDSSNPTDAFLRNRLRRNVLPSWREAVEQEGRELGAGVALARERCQEDDDALEAWLAELAPLREDGELMLSRLTGKPIAIWRRALHRWLGRHEPITDLSRAGFEVLLNGVRTRPHGRFSLGRNGFAVWRRGTLTFANGIRRTGAAR